MMCMNRVLFREGYDRSLDVRHKACALFPRTKQLTDYLRATKEGRRNFVRKI